MKQGSASSIRAALKKIADKENIDFQILVIRYLHERLLYRLSLSPHQPNFFLKGGALIYAIEGLHVRPTMDIDLLASKISNDKGEMKDVFRSVNSISYEADCVVFDSENIVVSEIKEQDKYSGLRVHIDACFDTIRQKIQIDIGFTDIISPAPMILEYPVLMEEFEKPVIRAYSIETVIAEKFHAMIALNTFNSRMKDFYDVYILLKNNTIDNNSLQEAIDKTFRQRNTVFVENHELFTNSFCENKNRQIMWKAFLRKIRISEELDFSNVMNTIVQRLYPIYKNILK